MTACAERIVALTQDFTAMLDAECALHREEVRIAGERTALRQRGDAILVQLKAELETIHRGYSLDRV